MYPQLYMYQRGRTNTGKQKSEVVRKWKLKEAFFHPARLAMPVLLAGQYNSKSSTKRLKRF